MPRIAGFQPASGQPRKPSAHPPQLGEGRLFAFVFDPLRKSPRTILGAPPGAPFPRMAFCSWPSTGQATQTPGSLDILLTSEYCHLHSIVGSVRTDFVGLPFQACIYLALDRGCPTPYLPAPISHIRSLA